VKVNDVPLDSICGWFVSFVQQALQSLNNLFIDVMCNGNVINTYQDVMVQACTILDYPVALDSF
jgi:hypothetical protein